LNKCFIQWAKSGGSTNFEKCIDQNVDGQGNCFMAGIGGGTKGFTFSKGEAFFVP